MSRNVLITGTSTGIGRSAALELAARGWRVFAGVRKEADGKALLAGLQDAKGELHPIKLDVARHDSIARAVAEVRAVTAAQLDGLVNNAGVYLGGPLELMTHEEIELTYAVNVTGLLNLTRACLPMLRAAKGRLVNISSISGLVALPGVSVYAGSKHAVEAITDSLRVELQPFGVKVIAVEPGGVKTAIWDKGAERDNARRDDPEMASLRQLYGPLVRLLEKLNARPGGVEPEAIAAQVITALETARPRNRYLVGADARALAFLNRLPEGLRDRAIARKIWR